MPSYKLYYFNAKGIGEFLRYLFALGQTDYEDKRFGNELKWEDFKLTAPFGKSPFLEIDGEKFGQSVSIARYLANAFNLAGKNDLERLKADGIVDCIHKDIISKFWILHFEKDEEKKAVIQKEMVENTIQIYEKLEDQVSGENTFLASGMSWADVALYNFHSDLYGDRFEAIDLTSRPKLKNIIANVSANEHIQKWISKRPITEA